MLTPWLRQILGVTDEQLPISPSDAPSGVSRPETLVMAYHSFGISGSRLMVARFKISPEHVQGCTFCFSVRGHQPAVVCRAWWSDISSRSRGQGASTGLEVSKFGVEGLSAIPDEETFLWPSLLARRAVNVLLHQKHGQLDVSKHVALHGCIYDG